MGIRIVVSVASILLLAIAGLVFYEYVKREALKSCEICLADVSVKSLSFVNATLEVRLRVYNPNSVTVTLDRVDYSLYVNDVYLGDGTIPREYYIPPGGTVTIITQFELSYSGALKTIWSYLAIGGKINWRMKGTAHIDTPIGTLDIPFDISL
jgi:LEA14-like dessication related protein